MFSRGRGRGSEGGAGRGFGFGNFGAASQLASNPFATAAQRFASANSFGSAGLGLALGTAPYTSMGGGVLPNGGGGLQAETPASSHTRPKVAIVGTTASAAAAWGTLYDTGYDVAVVAAGPDAFVETVDAHSVKKLEEAAKAFIKGCIHSFNVPKELTEAEKKEKEAAAAAATAKANTGPAVGAWSFLGTPGGMFSTSSMGAFGRPGLAAPVATPETPAPPPEDPVLRGVHGCAWTQLLTAPVFDEVDVVYVTSRGFPSAEKTSAVATPGPSEHNATTNTTGALGSGRSVGSARSRASSVSSGGGRRTAAHTNAHDGLEAFVLQCIERGKHVVLDTPPAAHAASVAAYVEAMTAAQKPKVCVMDHAAGLWMPASRLDALRGLCGLPSSGATAQTATAEAAGMTHLRGDRSSSGRRTIGADRFRNRGGSMATRTSVAEVTPAVAPKFESRVGEVCQLRLHVCVPRDSDENEAEKEVINGIDAPTVASDAVTRVTTLSSVCAQPGRQLSSAHPLLYHLPPPPPAPAATSTATSTSSSAAPPLASDDASTPQSRARKTTPVPAESAVISAAPDDADDATPLGVLGDVGYHAISFYLALFDWAMPVGVMARVLARHPVSEAPTSVEGTLYFRLPRIGASTKGTTAAAAASETDADKKALSEAEKSCAPPPRIVTARFFVSNDPCAPLTQSLSVNGTKGTLEVAAPLFPLRADLHVPTKSTSKETETEKARTEKKNDAAAVTGSSPAGVPSVVPKDVPEPLPEPPQSAAHYCVSEYTSATATALQLRVRSRHVNEETLPITVHPDAQLWMALRQALGLATAPAMTNDSTVTSTSATAGLASGRRGSVGATSSSSSYSRYRRTGSTLMYRGEPARFPVQETEVATKLAKAMWMTQQVVDSVRSATAASC